MFVLGFHETVAVAFGENALLGVHYDWLHWNNHLVLMVQIEGHSTQYYGFEVWTALAWYDSLNGTLRVIFKIFCQLVVD